MEKKIKRALISVFHKEGLSPIVKSLNALGIEILSTGGTFDFITELGIPCRKIEDLTQMPSILHGRVKTLHPAVFGGILAQRDNAEDIAQVEQYHISYIDLVIVDLYPFAATLQKGGTEEEIIEKIDIGGISLIRAGAKNYNDVAIVASRELYPYLQKILERGDYTTLSERRELAREAFAVSSSYDTCIYGYFSGQLELPTIPYSPCKTLRYGENPHQKGFFYGDLESFFTQLHGKELSYNNLQDSAAATELIREFDLPTFAIIKHTNACGLATASNIEKAWEKALEADPESAFGGILVANRTIDLATARKIGSLFFEVLIAPSFAPDALELLSEKKNRILLVDKGAPLPCISFRSMPGGVLVQQNDTLSETKEDCKIVSQTVPSAAEIEDCLFAQRIVKHCKSNAIVIAKEGQLLASGVGQTSRVAALRQALEKAKKFGFDLKGAVIASDAFFPFSDCIEIGIKEGIKAFIEPGGSIRDQESIEAADKHQAALIFTGIRHFRH